MRKKKILKCHNSNRSYRVAPTSVTLHDAVKNVSNFWIPFDDLNEATNLCFPVMPFTVFYRVVLTFECRWMKFLNVTIEMKGLSISFLWYCLLINAVPSGSKFRMCA